jgi:hypothetical protein
MRGRKNVPKPGPANDCVTRTQPDLAGSPLAVFQWKASFTRPWRSVWISSPSGPTTVARWKPKISGRAVLRSGRYGRLAAMPKNVVSQCVATAPDDSSRRPACATRTASSFRFQSSWGCLVTSKMLPAPRASVRPRHLHVSCGKRSSSSRMRASRFPCSGSV